MRAAVLTDDHTFAVADVADPQPRPGDLVLRVTACGICGSDLKAYPAMPSGAVLGHEFCGEVVATGSGVDPSWNGRLVAAMPLTACGRCRWCFADGARALRERRPDRRRRNHRRIRRIRARDRRLGGAAARSGGQERRAGRAAGGRAARRCRGAGSCRRPGARARGRLGRRGGHHLGPPARGGADRGQRSGPRTPRGSRRIRRHWRSRSCRGPGDAAGCQRLRRGHRVRRRARDGAGGHRRGRDPRAGRHRRRLHDARPDQSRCPRS